MAKEVRIALIMGGGVSLGAFSGGALAETVRLLAQTKAKRDGQTIKPIIDVVAGASAGSMTLGVLFSRLLQGAKPGAVKAAMRQAWVTGAGLDYGEDPNRQLLPDPDTHQTPSLLSDRPLRKLALDNIPVGGVRANPSDLLADEVYLSFAVANMNGLDVAAPWQLVRRRIPGRRNHPAYGDALVTTFHDDRVRFLYKKDGTAGGIHEPSRANQFADSRDARTWDLFRQAAIASGSFPLAFPPVSMRRKEKEYGRAWPESLKAEKEWDFSFVDGGTFRNEPLKEAIELANLRDAEHGDFERVFILIDPHVAGSHALRTMIYDDPLGLKTDYGDDGRPEEMEITRPDYARRLLSLGQRHLTMIAGQATFRDWIKAARLNDRVAWSGEFEASLSHFASGLNAASQTAIRRELGDLLDRIYGQKTGLQGDQLNKRVKAERRRIAGQITGLKANSLQADLILALRNIAGLRDKRQVNLVAVTPYATSSDPVPLAGNFMANFGGFFMESWRQHDFEVGRYAAGQVLTARISDAPPLISGTAPALTSPPRLPTDARYPGAWERVKEQFESVLHDHLENILYAAGVWDFIDHVVATKLKNLVVSGLNAPHGAKRHVLVRISGSGIDRNHELLATALGEDAEAGDDGAGNWVIETVIGLRHDADRRGPRKYWFEGPHLHEPRDGRRLILVRDRLIVTDKKLCEIFLQGSAKAWFDAADE